MARTRTAQRGMVERSIYFYRVDAGLDDIGRPLPFDPAPALRHIHALPFTRDGRYWENVDGNAICCWVDQNVPPHKLRLATVRRAGLPHLEQAGILSPLALPSASGLVEQIHVVFFRDNIVGAEFNFYGPRLSRLRQYLSEKAKDSCQPLTFEPLLRQDIADQLSRLQDVRLLQLRIRASYAATIAEADQDLGSAFAAAARAGEAEVLEITLRPPAYSRGRLSDRILSTVKRLAGLNDLRDEVSCFVLKGLDNATGRVELVDILSDQLIAKKQIFREDICSAHGAIEEAYNELQDQLLTAAGVRS
jgi:hypothetical protein